MIRFLFAAVACTGFLAAQSNANLILNGDFESGTLAPFSSSGTVMAVPTSVAFQTDGSVGSFPVSNGDFIAIFSGGDGPNDGVLVQEFSTSPQQRYEASFQYGVFSVNGTSQILSVVVEDVLSGNELANQSFSDFGSNDLSNLLQGYLLPFEATGTTTRLRFSDVSSMTNSVDIVLDNISLAVPEPTSALLLASGLLAYAGRRRFRRG